MACDSLSAGFARYGRSVVGCMRNACTPSHPERSLSRSRSSHLRTAVLIIFFVKGRAFTFLCQMSSPWSHRRGRRGAVIRGWRNVDRRPIRLTPSNCSDALIATVPIGSLSDRESRGVVWPRHYPNVQYGTIRQWRYD